MLGIRASVKEVVLPEEFQRKNSWEVIKKKIYVFVVCQHYILYILFLLLQVSLYPVAVVLQ